LSFSSFSAGTSFHDLLAGNIAIPHLGQEVIDRLKGEVLHNPLQIPDFMKFAKSRWYFLNSRSQISFPKSTERSRASDLIHCRILVLAREVLTCFSQCFAGLVVGGSDDLDMSRFEARTQGNDFAFTLAPTHCDRSRCGCCRQNPPGWPRWETVSHPPGG